jgi:hypothetical protein
VPSVEVFITGPLGAGRFGCVETRRGDEKPWIRFEALSSRPGDRRKLTPTTTGSTFTRTSSSAEIKLSGTEKPSPGFVHTIAPPEDSSSD